ncbi:phosphatase PAP2 family protein [Kitasatospora sp. NA04385]|uniref:phosphatase PAP2 family protein n=1 Tax=Kitasatospora sp. NA04385 TaxID=2742135 RepID=UPI00159159CA|nr:phosphatase PAP2 family protein [Kitasatospora sp. NA04385]QKW21230.1 phosphatase PAP2 family protein [Kitasatospora sp. NA04385]
MHQSADHDSRAAADGPDGGRRGGRSPARPPVQRAGALRCAWPALAGALAFAVLLVLVRSGWAPLARFDQGWVALLHRYALRHPVWTAAMQTLGDLGAPWMMRTALGAVAVWLWVRGARVLAGWAAAVVLLGWAVGGAGRELIGRAGPHLADPVAAAPGASFPAGHALATAVTCGALLALAWPRIERPARVAAGTAGALVVLAVGWTRIALGLHWPSDVLASWAAAVVVLAGPALAVELWRPGLIGLDARLLRRRTGPRVQRVLAPPLERVEPPSPPLGPPGAPTPPPEPLEPVTERDPGRS